MSDNQYYDTLNKYKHNFNGLKTEPWGTPQIILAKSDKTLSIWTRWVRLENMTQYILVHYHKFRHIFSSMQNRLSWSMVSKAADESGKTSFAPLPLPILVTISLYHLNKAV